MAGFYSHLSDKKLALQIKKCQSGLTSTDKRKKIFNAKKIKVLEKEKNDRLRKSVMSIKNLTN